MIPAERRLPEAPGLAEQLGHFVVHAPRQTGKTTALIALAASLTASGRYAAVLFDRRTTADVEDIETRTRFEEAVTPSGRKVTLLRA